MARNKNRLPVAPEPSSSGKIYQTMGLLAGLVWAFFVLRKFYDFQPFSFFLIPDILFPSDLKLFPTAAALLGHGQGLFFGILVLGAAFFWGHLVLRFFRLSVSSLETAVFSVGLGYGILAYITFALGALQLYRKPIFFIFIGGSAFLQAFLFTRKPFLKSLWEDAGAALFPGGMGTVFGFLFLFILGTDIVMAFVPEIFYDALVYHLGVPNFYLLEGGIKPIDVLPAKFPLTVQMIHLIGLALKGEVVAKLNHVFMMGTLGFGLMGLARRLERPQAGSLMAVLFCSIPTAQINVWSSGVDMGVSLFAFLSISTALLAAETGSLSGVALAAIFSGLTLSSKYTAFYIALMAGLCLVWGLKKTNAPFIKWAKTLALFGCGVFLVVFPWLVKNYLETHNPFFPFLCHIFGWGGLTPERYQHLRDENYGIPLGSVFRWLTVFWNLSIRERSSLSFQGPVYLMLGPLLLLGVRRFKARPVLILMIIAICFLCVVLPSTRLTRYWLPGLTIWAVLLAVLMEDLNRRVGWPWKIPIFSLLIVGILAQLSWSFAILHASYGPRDVLLGLETRNAYMMRYHPGMNPGSAIGLNDTIANLPLKSRVIQFPDEKGYPFPVRHYYSGVYDTSILVRYANEAPTAKALSDRLIKEGFTHLIVNVMEIHRLYGYKIFGWTEQGYAVFDDFWKHHLAFLEAGKADDPNKLPIVLFKIIPDEANIPPTMAVPNFFDPFKPGVPPR